jgi:hypothetical protein
MVGQWEEFTRRGAPVIDKPLVTIQKSGSLGLNRAAYQALGEPSLVVLMFNREEQLIGIRVADQDTEHAYPLRKQQQSESYLIAGRAFVGHYNIEHESARRYQAEIQGDILAVNLKQGGIEVGRNSALSRHARFGQ